MTIPYTRHDQLLRRLIAWLGAIGATAFLMLLALALLRPVTIEKWARAAIATEVQERVGEKLDAMEDSALARSAERILVRNNQAIEKARQALSRKVPSLISVVIDAMLHPDCPCRQRALESDHRAATYRIAELAKDNAQLTRLIESKYRDVAGALVREVKIVSAANATVFLLLMLTARWWKRPALQLLAPAVVMVGACGITAAVYLLNQNWLHTILFGDYVGLYYLAYLLLAAALLADVVFNLARLTKLLLGGVLGALGAVFGMGC